MKLRGGSLKTIPDTFYFDPLTPAQRRADNFGSFPAEKNVEAIVRPSAKGLFLRFYGHEFNVPMRARIPAVINQRRIGIVPSPVPVASVMAFSELELKRIEQTVGVFCGKRSPVHLKDKLRLTYAVKGHGVVIIERRPRWDNQTEWTESPVAKLKFIRSAGKWRLYWMRADQKWHEYPRPSSSHRLEDLVQEIDADPLACFFG